MITFIWAQDEAGNIGKDNTMPWHLPADLAYFKKQTTGHTIVVGRKTYESFGRALPNRRNIVLSRDPDLQLPDAEVVHDKADVLKLAETEDVFVCGGAEIYRLFHDQVSRLFVTKIGASFEADTAFPELDWSKFREVSRIEGQEDEKNRYPFAFYTYERVDD
ncbi:dihydrofolate reductase [Listeria valentina]|uniref:dihydrofolate reductase n=1 Tax=Listeria valentina TaxID=2705293 RepID=UPI0014312C2E|nr:dihydrofolate reductase [Listeria valentina]